MFTVKNFPGQSFSAPVIISAGILILIAVALIVFVIRMSRGTEREKKKEIPPKRRAEIKNNALGELWQLRESFLKGDSSVRDTYQSMSALMRDFTYEMTGESVKHFTLKELRKKRLPGLTAVIQDYYEPEFASHTKADTLAAIEKTRRVIENWI